MLLWWLVNLPTYSHVVTTQIQQLHEKNFPYIQLKASPKQTQKFKE